jgi:hypothetical protein
MKGRRCYGATFDSYREMLAHCRQNHPDCLPFGGDPTAELVVTDTQGNILSWEEIRQIVDDPSFWREPPNLARGEEEAVAPLVMRCNVQVGAIEQAPRLNKVAQKAIHV